MTEGSPFSEANETGGRRMAKVTPIDGGGDSGCDSVKIKTSTFSAESIITSGTERVESLTDCVESSNRLPVTTMAPTSTSDESDEPRSIPENADKMRPQEQEPPAEDYVGSGGRGRAATPAMRRQRSLPPARVERTPSVAAAASHCGRFSDGMIDVSGIQEGDAETKRVSFGRLSVRKYPIVLGDHPDCSCGPPVTIDWMYREFRPVNVEDYETRRPARRNEREMILPYLKRREILTRVSGHTEMEIKEATMEAARVRKQRKQTVKTLQFQRVEEAMQTTMRGLRKLRPGSGGGSSKASYPGKLTARGEAKTKDASTHRKSRRCPGMDGGASAMDSRSHLRQRHRGSLHKARIKTQV